MRAISYTPDWAADWNRLTDEAKNGTFLFRRSYMDYHSDRFADCSLLFTDSSGRPAALFPANYDAASRTVWSHQGLTYGGLIMRRDLNYDPAPHGSSTRKSLIFIMYTPPTRTCMSLRG